MVTKTTAGSSAPDFEHEAQTVISSLRRAVGDLLDRLPIPSPAGPTELGRRLGIDTKLAWKITRLLQANDLFEAGLFVPGAMAARRFLDAAAAQADGPQVAEARARFAQFEDLARSHAGDRRSLDLMLAGQRAGAARQAELELRKSAYQANGFLWGVQARVQLKTAIVAPAADGERIDAAVINGFFGLRRIRPRAPWRISSAYSVDDDGQVHTGFDWRPLDPALGEHDPATGPPLVSRFCSDPLPPMEVATGEAGAVQYAFRGGPVGRRGAVDCVIGEVLGGVEPRFRQPGYEVHGVFLRLNTPCELAVLDLLVHRELFPEFAPRIHCFSGLYSGELFKRHLAADELPLSEPLVRIGTGADFPRLAEMPRYRELIRFSFDALRWDPDAFDLHRIQIPLPPTPTVLVARQELPAHGA